MEKKGKVQKTERLLGKLTAAAGHMFLVGDSGELEAFLAAHSPEDRGRLAIEKIGRGKTGLRPFEEGGFKFAVCSFFPASEVMLLSSDTAGLHLVPAQVDKWRVTLAMPTLTEVILAEFGSKPTMTASVSVPSGVLSVVRVFPAWRHESPPLGDEERAALGRGGQHGTKLVMFLEPGEHELTFERLSRAEEWGTISGRVAIRRAAT